MHTILTFSLALFIFLIQLLATTQSNKDVSKLCSPACFNGQTSLTVNDLFFRLLR